MTNFIPIGEAARFVGRSPRWIRRRLLEIPHYRPPEGQILFKSSDLEGYLARFRVEPAQPPKIDLDAILNDIDRVPRHRRSPNQGG